MQELPSDSFTFGNYNANIPFGVFTDSKKLVKWIKENNPIGYSKRPSFKQQDGYIAVLFDLEEQGEYWSHVPVYVFDKYINEIKV